MGKGASKEASASSVKQQIQKIDTTGKRVLLFGGNGGLGNTIVKTLKSNGATVITVDFKPCPEADQTIQVSSNVDSQAQEVNTSLASMNSKFDLIINVAGGFVMGGIEDPDLINQVTKMINYNLKSAFAAAQVAAKFLNAGGLLVLTGAAAATADTPKMLAYGASKAAVHAFVKSLASPQSDMPASTKTIAILPVMLDTPTNRNAMPNADTSGWTPLSHVAEKVNQWLGGKEIPENGELVKVETVGGVTTWKAVKTFTSYV